MKKRGRPPFRTEEEKKAAKRRIHTRAMRECKWYCEVCQREYSLGCKTNHLNTKNIKGTITQINHWLKYS